MTADAPDPGGIFPSDVHRRVLGHLPPPGTDPMPFTAVLLRLNEDVLTPIGLPTPAPEAVAGDAQAQVNETVEELRATLQAIVDAGDAETQGDNYRQTATGFEKLTGPIANEPKPLEGARMKAAEALDEELAREDEETRAQIRKDRVERAKAELAEAEAELAEHEKKGAKS